MSSKDASPGAVGAGGIGGSLAAAGADPGSRRAPPWPRQVRQAPSWPQAALAALLLLLALGGLARGQETLSGAAIEIRHPSGMEGAAARVLEVYPRLKEEVETRLGLRYTRKLDIWLERSHADFNARITALGGGPKPEHVAAVAFPYHDVVVMKADAWRRGAPGAFEVTFQHEIVHCLLGELRRRHPEMTLPTWLDEGIAQWASEAVFFGSPDLLAQAIRQGSLIPFEELRRDFPDQEGASALAYAQSHSLVRFIAERGNPTGRKNNIQGLLLQLMDGSEVEDAVRAVTGLGFDELEKVWEGETGAALPFSLRDVPEMVFGIAIFVLALLAFSVQRVRRAQRLAQFEAEERAQLALEADPETEAERTPAPQGRLGRIHDFWKDRPKDRDDAP